MSLTFRGDWVSSFWGDVRCSSGIGVPAVTGRELKSRNDNDNDYIMIKYLSSKHLARFQLYYMYLLVYPSVNATCGSPLPGAVFGRSDWLRVESENKTLFSVITSVYKSYNDILKCVTHLVLEIHVM